MNIYQIAIQPLETPYQQILTNALPAPVMTLGSKIELNEICIMMLVKEAMRKLLEDLQDVSIDMTQDQNSYNRICENKGDQDVLMLCPSIKVDAPSEWHVVANPLAVMHYLDVITDFDEDGLYFDMQHPSTYVEHSSDYDHDSVSTGCFTLNEDSGEWTAELQKECAALQPLFNFPEMKAYMHSLLSQLMQIEDYKDKEWGFYPAKHPNPVLKAS